MSWLFSRALVEASSAGICSGGGQSAPSSATPTPQAFLWRDKTTAAWRRFPSGMTSEPLTADRGEELLTLYQAGFPARTYQPQERAPESTANNRASGEKWQGSLARYDRVSRSWKTPQCLLFEDLAECLEIWPKWGTTRAGVAYRQPTPSLLLEIRQRITGASESGLSLRLLTPHGLSADQGQGGGEFDKQIRRLPTPLSRDWKSGCVSRKTMSKNSRPLNEQIGGKLNPQWVEWLMGWPIGWTDLGVLETDKFQQWRHSRGDR